MNTTSKLTYAETVRITATKSYCRLPNFASQVLALRLCIWEVLSTNLGPEISSHDCVYAACVDSQKALNIHCRSVIY
jgi:hypothetical protein